MSMNPLNDISAVYLKEVLKPQLGKEAPAKKEGGEKPSAEGGEKKEGDASAGSAKRIRQAVYDIRYRARREEIPVQQAYNQYMSHTTMTGPEKSEVKSKLGEEKVNEAIEEKKFQVRVTDKNSGKSYVRMATREKINQLRANPNISSVEMTKYGSPYEGEKKKGEQTAKVKSGKGLDPVGREDKDIDNDGDHDKTDKYLLNRRKVRGAAIEKKNVKEGFSNWREDLVEVANEIEDKKKEKIKEKKVANKITINPPLKESISNLGGTLLEMVEIDEFDFIVESVYEELFCEGYEEGDIEEAIEYALVEAKVTYGHDTDSPKVQLMKTAKGRLKSLGKKVGEKIKSAKKAAKYASAKAQVSAYNKGREVAQSASDKTKKVKSGVKSAIKKVAQKVVDRMSEETEIGEEKRPFPFKKVAAQQEKARKGSVYGKPATNEPAPNVSDKEKKETGRFSKMHQASEKAKREKQVADKARRSSTFYKDTHPASAPKMKKANEEFENIEEKAPPGAKFERMVKHIKKGYAKDGGLTDKEKSIAYATAWKAKNKMSEAMDATTGVSKEPVKASKTQSTAQDAQRKQQVQQLRTMIMKKRQLQNQELALQKQGKLPVDTHATENFEMNGNSIEELNRYEKETGKSSGSLNMPKGRPTQKGGETDLALRAVRQTMRKMSGKPAGQQKKVPGKKPPKAGEYGAPASPAQKVAKRRAAAQRSQDMMHSRFD